MSRLSNYFSPFYKVGDNIFAILLDFFYTTVENNYVLYKSFLAYIDETLFFKFVF